MGKNVPYDIFYSRKMAFFDILLFSNFTAAEMRKNDDFWQNIVIFTQKIALSAHFGSRKIVKKQNIQKSLFKVVANTLRYIFVHF